MQCIMWLQKVASGFCTHVKNVVVKNFFKPLKNVTRI